MYAVDIIETHDSITRRWTVPLAAGMLFTYVWFLLLTFGMVHEAVPESEPLQLVLEEPQPRAAPQPPPPPQLQPKILPPPRLLTRPAQPQTIEPVLPLQPEETPLETTAESVVTESAPVIIDTSPVSAPVETPQPLKVERLSRLTQPYKLNVETKRAYPKSEIDQQRQARVAVQFVIDELGLVRDIKILQSGGAAFDQAVIEVLQNSKNEPGKIGERPVAAPAHLVFEFELK